MCSHSRVRVPLRAFLFFCFVFSAKVYRVLMDYCILLTASVNYNSYIGFVNNLKVGLEMHNQE